MAGSIRTYPIHQGAMPKLSKGGSGWRFPGRENNKGHEVGGVGKNEVGDRGRTQLVQGMRHLDFTRRMVVTCP